MVVHGGPGGSHDYLLPPSALAKERPVVFYDQVGCGNSEQPSDTALWSISRYAEELDIVRRTLRLKPAHILGHSWGAMLALAFLGQFGEKNIYSLILFGPLVDTDRWLTDAKACLAQFPEELQQQVKQAKQSGAYDSEDYQNAMIEFYKRHLCRLSNWPEELTATIKKLSAPIYQYMWGPSEFTVLGTLKEASMLPVLKTLSLPVLFTAGEYDEAAPRNIYDFQRLTKDSCVQIFTDASHNHHLEKTVGYLNVVSDFLSRIDSKHEAAE
ncbi:MAG: proline iminopeptidase-family hydrolase [Deltaproteobacteria bacterium]|nr:proline iminopeptidase-family hydrolase [Deltaproteobacteria bacterium]